LKNLAVEIAPRDVEQALAAAAAIEFAEVRAPALAAVGANLVAVDVPRAAKVLAEAVETAREIEDPATQAAELGGIAAALAGVARPRAEALLDEALALAGAVQETTARATALREMVMRWATVDAERTQQLAAAALAAASDLSEAKVKDYTLRLIAAALAGIGLEPALAVVQAIDLPAFKVRAWCDVALEVARTDPPRGRELFNFPLSYARHEIDDPKVRDMALRDVAAGLAEVDLDEALALAKTIEDAYARARALVSVGRVAAGGSRFPR
jgi:hypothetical protein